MARPTMWRMRREDGRTTPSLIPERQNDTKTSRLDKRKQHQPPCMLFSFRLAAAGTWRFACRSKAAVWVAAGTCSDIVRTVVSGLLHANDDFCSVRRPDVLPHPRQALAWASMRKRDASSSSFSSSSSPVSPAQAFYSRPFTRAGSKGPLQQHHRPTL